MNNLEYFIKAGAWRNNQYTVSKKEAFTELERFLDCDSLRELLRFRIRYRALCKQYYKHFDGLYQPNGYALHWQPVIQWYEAKKPLFA
jgi:hypothetical protein